MKNGYNQYWIIVLTDIYQNYFIKFSEISIDLRHA